MNSFPKKLSDKIAVRKEEDSFRNLPEALNSIDFSSNDYLGFAGLDALALKIKEVLSSSNLKTGATGSRLISGNHSLYNLAEAEITRFHNVEAALIFNSGYDANIGFFSSVPQKGDLILFDAYIHASIRDGLRMSNAEAWKFKHNDIKDLKEKVKRANQKFDLIYVVTEAVFSMDGDTPPMNELIACCEEHNCLLVVDEAHSLGVMGNNGEGLLTGLGLQNKIFASVVTFGKAMGVHGAAILGSEDLKNYLVNFARSLIYTTALPPHSIAGIIAAYRILAENKAPFEQLRKRINYFKEKVKEYKLDAVFLESDSAVQSAIIPGVEHVKKVASQLARKGYEVKPILAPTVPKGSERLRFCLHSYNSEHQMAAVLNILATFATDNFKKDE
jgi:8-amino-7-oxononanoate synthase